MKRKKVTSHFYGWFCIFLLLPLEITFMWSLIADGFDPIIFALNVIMIPLFGLALAVYPVFCVFDDEGILLIYLLRRYKKLKWDEIDNILVNGGRTTDYVLCTKNKDYRVMKSRRTMKYLYHYWGDFGDDTGFLEFVKEIIEYFKPKKNKKEKKLNDEKIKELEREARAEVRDILKSYEKEFESLKLKAWQEYGFEANGYSEVKRPKQSYRYMLELTVTDIYSNIHSPDQLYFTLPLLQCRLKKGEYFGYSVDGWQADFDNELKNIVDNVTALGLKGYIEKLDEK